MIQAVLFDLDGTFLNTVSDLAYAVNTFLGGYGYSPVAQEKLKPFIAGGCQAMVGCVTGKSIKDPEVSQLCKGVLALYAERICQHTRKFVGIDEVLDVLGERGVLWGIVTNKSEHLTHSLLNTLGIHPHVVVCGDTLPYKKPHPAPVLYAIEQLGVVVGECIFVGDDVKDIEAGRGAGVRTVAVSYGYGRARPEWGYHFLLDKPTDLIQILDEHD